MEEKKEIITIKDKCKGAQNKFNYKLDPDKPIIVHIDGKNFSKLIKNNFKKPFDERFIEMMNDTAKFVCKNVQGVKVAYVQSDEISLLIWKSSPDSEIPFDGRLCKLQSIIAALATSEFNRHFILNTIYKSDAWDNYDNSNVCTDISTMKMAQFDCKVWNVDTIDDAYLWLLFRNIDCVRNSKQQAAQTYLPNKQLQNVNTDYQIAMLKKAKGIDWAKYPEDQKYGRIIIKKRMHYKNEDNGEEYDRRVWSVEDGLDLTIADNRDKLREMVTISEQDCKTNER